MATSLMDKGLYAAPVGIMETMEPALEIEIENPDSVTLSDGSMEITLMPDDINVDDFDANLAEFLDEGDLQTLASDMVELVEADVNARKEWADTYVKGLEVLGFKYEERTEPWDDACGVYSTVLAEAVIRFQAETMSETFPAQGPVKSKIIGEMTKEKEESANRVKADMNYQLTERMVEYRSEHERMLYSLGLAGSAFKKVYYDPILKRQVSLYISAEDMIVPYGASHIDTAERVTHMMRKTKTELRKLQADGFYRDVEMGDPIEYFSDIEKKKAEEGGYTLSSDDRFALYEIHTYTTINGIDDEDDLPKPYVITVVKGTNEVLSIRRNWSPNDERQLKRQHFVHYIYVPGFGFYGLGLIHIIGGYARAGTSIIRQLVDAGTLSNLPGGLKARGLRIKGDDTPIAPGEFRDVDVPSGTVRDNIMTLPYKEPSQVLAGLLEKITQEGRRLGAISDMNISDMSSQAPVGTTLALLERTLKPMAAVQARVHFSMKQEFKLLKEIIADYANDPYDYIPEGVDRRARAEDYAVVEVIPVSDPNATTMAQRVVQYQAAFQMAQSAPQIYDLPYLHRQMLETLGIRNADKVVPLAEDQKPRDPMSENMGSLVGKPMKAFIYQDHDAHILAHQSFMQDPMIAQAIGQNPMAQQIMSSLQAHIAEHLGFVYRKQLEERLGVQLPGPNEDIPEELEVEISKLVAQAGVQLTQMHQAEAAQKQAQAQAQDPIVQMQQAELQIKQGELQRKAQKDAADLEIANRKVSIEEQKVMVEAQKEGTALQTKAQQTEQKTQLEMIKLLTQRNQKSR